MTLLAEPPADACASPVEAVTPVGLIRQVRDARRRREVADRDVLALGLAWAVSHEVGGPIPGRVGGSGCSGDG